VAAANGGPTSGCTPLLRCCSVLLLLLLLLLLMLVQIFTRPLPVPSPMLVLLHGVYLNCWLDIPAVLCYYCSCLGNDLALLLLLLSSTAELHSRIAGPNCCASRQECCAALEYGLQLLQCPL
jgi:hypothetical protein